ncbi:MAG: hypothetical protein NVSMB22_19770 [Chloroflexota bacterium]
MAIERQQLRDELAAVIAAGRELAPEYDHVLADLFLDLALRTPRKQSGISWLIDDPRRLRAALAAACLAVAALIFLLFAFHDEHGGGVTNQSVFAPRVLDPDQLYGRSEPWWNGGNPNQGIQSP